MGFFTNTRYACILSVVVLLTAIPIFTQGQQFQVRINGEAVGHLVKVILPEFTTEVVEYQSGDELHTRFRLGSVSKTNLVIKRYKTHDEFLSQWFERCSRGENNRATVEVILPPATDRTAAPARPEIRWEFTGALPVKYISGTYKDGVLIETLEILFEGFSEH